MSLLTPECYNTYFVEHDFLDAACFSALLSKGLGYGIVLGSIILKLPQLMKIVRSGSVQGIAFSGVLLELVGYTCALAYSYSLGIPFSAYGEYVFITLQVIIQVLLHAYYARLFNAVFFIGAIVYSFFAYFLLGGLAPPTLLWMLLAATIPIFSGARVPQIISNYKLGSTGQLSFITFMLNFGGSAARLFTTLKEVGIDIMLAGFVVGTVLNGIIVVQFILYWNKGKKD